MVIDMDLDAIWQDYGLDRLAEGIRQLFPKTDISARKLLEQVISGDITGALSGLFTAVSEGMTNQLLGMKQVFLWLLVMGIVSALMTHFVEIFDVHQVAEMSFYFIYLLFTAVLLQCFSEASETASRTLEDITLFIRLLAPAYLLSVGVSAGAATVAAACQLMLLVIYGIEYVLSRGAFPLVCSFVMLSMINGIWAEERLAMLIGLLEKAVSWILKGVVWGVTGISVFQALISPVVDSVKRSALQKIVSAIPGVGGAADGAVELVLGSALVLKNSIGVVLLLLILALCAAPLLRIGLIACMLKCAAAFAGMVSDKRISMCIDRAGDGGLLLLKTTATAMLLFLISIAVVTM